MKSNVLSIELNSDEKNDFSLIVNGISVNFQIHGRIIIPVTIVENTDHFIQIKSKNQNNIIDIVRVNIGTLDITKVLHAGFAGSHDTITDDYIDRLDFYIGHGIYFNLEMRSDFFDRLVQNVDRIILS
jgi:RNase P/RNase MRP subunit p30